jgi:anthranilate synthase/aminodeoxychorismate synthase-like glutamine amidotransferase
VILLLDNYDSFTWNLVACLGTIDPAIQVGRSLLVVRSDRITPDEAEALDAGSGPARIIISPGPGGPSDAGASVDIIRRFAGRVPILGVCLGHQCIAAAFGLGVSRHAVPVHGKTSLVWHDARGLFEGLPCPFAAARYHSLAVPRDAVPPARPGEDGWEVSAWTEEESPAGDRRRVVMGLRHAWATGGAPLDGVQFHPESFLTPQGSGLLANFLRSEARARSALHPAGRSGATGEGAV